jgi:hypothetical protein
MSYPSPLTRVPHLSLGKNGVVSGKTCRVHPREREVAVTLLPNSYFILHDSYTLYQMHPDLDKQAKIR